MRRLLMLLLVQRRGAAALARHRVVFLGSPKVAASTLDALLGVETVDVVAAVSQPPAKKGRKKVLQPSEVHALAEARQLPILTPVKASDPAFLDALRSLQPDLCVTAAFGQFLPAKFLEIPKFGTWNIHPSLLPKYRGAAPLQRSLEAGDEVVGVTVLETVLKMDAGPVVARARRPVRDDDEADALLTELFLTGLDLLVDQLPNLWDGTVDYVEQDDDLATSAPKIDATEARLDLSSSSCIPDARSIAKRAADKVRAFAPWPGTWLAVKAPDGDVLRLKVLRARVAGTDALNSHPHIAGDAIRVPCADGSCLDLLTVQPPGKKPMDARAFWNGLRQRLGREFHRPAALMATICINPRYGQCGGVDDDNDGNPWSDDHDACCSDGFECTYSSQHCSQCLPTSFGSSTSGCASDDDDCDGTI
ncbi:hypothetical protein CTAYLR_009425 [Chrysophaeum taylorii]|uniref:Methionyl-tRNA formyltransferase, mitochondrial n=1 Tax=Chrysophaeum taylorii TaxID=2483200 RepID=A0AAD7UJY1_9STRA|nr:hypothetical protein CTAYLR_009425 [Chrysophaeum taylorii]